MNARRLDRFAVRRPSRRWLLAGFLAILLCAPAAPAQAQGQGQAPAKFRPKAHGVPSQYMVVLKDEAAGSRGHASKAPQIAQELAAVHGGAVTAVYRHALNGFALQIPEAAARALSRDPRVAYVEQDVVGSIAATQINPPSWGLDRIDQQSLPLNASYTYQQTGAGVNAYVIDTGIRASHNDFGGRAVAVFDAVGDGRNGEDCHGHGTHVAGTLGGTTYGVAKSVQIRALRVLNCSGSGVASQATSAVDWITANRGSTPSVVNMSINYPVSTPLETAVRNSITSGVTYVIAAGNSNISGPSTSPQRVTEAIIVGATTISDARASFSNFGPTLDLFAPGNGITSAWWTSNTAQNTINGTSMAAPHVAGAAALYLQGNPTAKPVVVSYALVDHASSGLSGIGAGSPNRLLWMSAFDGAAPGTRITINLQASNNQYVVAENAGGGVINANRIAAGPFETFTLVDRNGGTLNHGDSVHVYTVLGWVFQAPNGGGGALVASGTMPHGWETFVIQKMSGSGGSAILNGDKVALRTFSGHYVVAEGGGGGVVNANRTSVGPWETFTLKR